jgi:hypothetical protein
MRPVTRTPWLLAAMLSACALPPRADDASTPELTFETFRGALAREEFDRAYGLLSDRLRKKIGVESRAEFMDWGAVGGRKAVSAFRRAKAKGAAEPLPDGRALLRVRVSWLFFGRDVTLFFTRIPVARAYVEGSEAAVFYEHLEGLDLVQEGGIAGVRLPPEFHASLKEGVGGGRLRGFEARIEWFLDDYDMGDEERE